LGPFSLGITESGLNLFKPKPKKILKVPKMGIAHKDRGDDLQNHTINFGKSFKNKGILAISKYGLLRY
jgi:hypothetical protein